MRTVLLRYYSPAELGISVLALTDKQIKASCFRANKYGDETSALIAYSETPATWSTLIDETCDVQECIDIAYEHIKNNDIDWLEQNFV